jgi:hypothetical protein
MKTKIAADGATIKINGSLSQSWKTTIAGNRIIQLVNIDDGDTISVTVVQASPGNYNLTWQASDLTIVWAGGQAPRLPRAVGASATYTFVREGSNLRQLSSAGALRRRITDAPAQAVTFAIAATSLIVALMGTPSGQAIPGANPDIAVYASGSGCTLLLTGTGSAGPCTLVRRDTGSGDLLLSSSGGALNGVGVGVPNLTTTSKIGDALLRLTADGKIRAVAVSGSTLHVTGVAGAAIGQAACFKTGKQVGYCSTTPTDGTCTCN